MERGDLQRLSKDELIDLVPRLQRPHMSSRTSSKPPSLDRKERRDNSKPGGALPGHEGHWRKLPDTPDFVRDHRPLVCEGCEAVSGPDAAPEVAGEDDGIEIAPVRPLVTRHRRLCLQCAKCGARHAS